MKDKAVYVASWIGVVLMVLNWFAFPAIYGIETFRIVHGLLGEATMFCVGWNIGAKRRKKNHT